MNKEENSSWSTYIKDTLIGMLQTINELGVKPRETDLQDLNAIITEADLAKHQQDLKNLEIKQRSYPPSKDLMSVEDPDSKSNAHQRNIRSTYYDKYYKQYQDKKQNPYFALKGDYSDLDFIAFEGIRVSHKSHEKNFFSNKYYNLVMAIYDLYDIVEDYNKENPKKSNSNDIYKNIILIAENLGKCKIIFNHIFWVVEGKNGKLGLPDMQGFRSFIKHDYDYINYILKNAYTITKTMDKAITVLDRFQENHVELFKNHSTNENNAQLETEVITKILSSLKAVENIKAKEFDEFMFPVASVNHKSQPKYYTLLGLKHQTKESAKECLKNVNQKLLSKDIDTFSLHKYGDESDKSFMSLTESYQKSYDNLTTHQTVQANKEILDLSFLSQKSEQQSASFFRPLEIESFQCRNNRVASSTNNQAIQGLSSDAGLTVGGIMGVMGAIGALGLLYKWYANRKKETLENTTDMQEALEINVLSDDDYKQPEITSPTEMKTFSNSNQNSNIEKAVKTIAQVHSNSDRQSLLPKSTTNSQKSAPKQESTRICV